VHRHRNQGSRDMYLQLAHDERDKPCICPPVTRITAGIYQSTQARGAYSAPSDPLLVESGASCPLPKTPPLLGAYRVLPRPPSWWRGGWLTPLEKPYPPLSALGPCLSCPTPKLVPTPLEQCVLKLPASPGACTHTTV